MNKINSNREFNREINEFKIKYNSMRSMDLLLMQVDLKSRVAIVSVLPIGILSFFFFTIT